MHLTLFEPKWSVHLLRPNFLTHCLCAALKCLLQYCISKANETTEDCK